MSSGLGALAREAALERENAELRRRVRALESRLGLEGIVGSEDEGGGGGGEVEGGGGGSGGDRAAAMAEAVEASKEPVRGGRVGLDAMEVELYSRQVLVRGFGAWSQRRLRESSVLVVGCGGLGCPAALYLAGAGVGRLGLVDGDCVERSNLHRQVGHRWGGEGEWKVRSLAQSIRRLSAVVEVVEFPEHLKPSNAMHIMRHYDVVLDCSDNPATRYLVSDACVQACKPLVFGAALGLDGQVAVFNHPPRFSQADAALPNSSKCPCYRCIFPKPPPPAAVGSCADSGVIGPTTGIVGTMQALQTIAVILSSSTPSSSSTSTPTEDSSSSSSSSTSSSSSSSTSSSSSSSSLSSSSSSSSTSPSSSTSSPTSSSPPSPLTTLAGKLFLCDLSVPRFRCVKLRPPRADCNACGGSVPSFALQDINTSCDLETPIPASIPLPTHSSFTLQGIPIDADPTTIHLPAEAVAFLKQDSPEKYIPTLCYCRRGRRSVEAALLLRAQGVDAWSLEGGLDAFRETVDPSLPKY